MYSRRHFRHFENEAICSAYIGWFYQENSLSTAYVKHPKLNKEYSIRGEY